MSAERINVDELLRRVRSRWLLRDALLSVARLLLVLGPMCLLFGWLDYRMDFTKPTRAVELAVLVAAAAWVVRRWVWAALVQRRDDVNTALRVEASDGRFGGRLVSRIEFARGMMSEGVSPGLVAEACRRVDAQSVDVDADHVIDLRPTHQPAIAALVVAITLAAVVIAEPPLAGLWLKRTFQPWSNAAWPRRTRIEDLEVDRYVRRGASLSITGRCAGEIPADRTGELRWRTGGGTIAFGRSNSKVFDVADDGTFSVTIGPLLESMEVTVHAGDATTASLPVEVVVPPELASIEADYVYPEFTGREPDRVQSGDVRAIIGTRVTVTLNADKPVTRAVLAFAFEGQRESKPVDMTTDTTGSAAFDVMHRGRYQVRLVDRHGFETDSPATFVIDPIENELPTVQLTRPGMEHRVTPMTRLRMTFDAADDFGVSGAAIRWRKAADGDSAAATQAMGDEEVVPIGLDAPLREWTGQYVWDLAMQDLQPGDRIAYHVEVYDEGPHLTEATAGVSAMHYLEVVEPEVLSRSLEAQIRDAFGELDYLVRQQAIGLDETTAAMLALPTGEEPVIPAEMQRLQVEVNRQVRIARQMDRLAGRLSAVADELQDSFLAEPDRVTELRDLATRMRELADGPMPDAAEALRQARAVLRDASQEGEP